MVHTMYFICFNALIESGSMAQVFCLAMRIEDISEADAHLQEAGNNEYHFGLAFDNPLKE
jgi:hypothetical protein